MKFTVEEVKHFFLPRENVINSYVVVNNKEITDFFSFYYLPSSILKNPKYQTLNVRFIINFIIKLIKQAAYSFYFIANKVSLKDLYENALIIANNS